MSDVELEVRAELDLPGETGRQGRVFQIWLLCLLSAVLLVVMRRPTPPSRSFASEQQEQEQRLQTWKRERAGIALGLGLIVPAWLTWWVTYRRRRGGPHARGVVIDVTHTGELRVWGRGYGDRVALPGAQAAERLVDVFTGRMGAWRQRRLLVRSGRPLPGSRSTELELATVASEQDEALGLRLDGGEGNCLELSRADFMAVRAAVMQAATAPSSNAPASEPPTGGAGAA